MKQKHVLIVAAIVGLAALGYVVNDGREEREYDACVERGVAYYKEIGSYPNLSTGRLAEEQVVERCQRTTTAFPE